MSSLRIMTNTAAINARRNMDENDRIFTRNIEHLSSGLAISRAKDGPSSLIISEMMRSQIASLAQAVSNTEEGISVMTTVDAAMNEVNRMLLTLRQLAVHASNEAVNDSHALQADQEEVENILDSVRRISSITQYGSKDLLNGSGEISGAALGEDLVFLGAGREAGDSPEGGFSVEILRAATRPAVSGTVPLDQLLAGGQRLELTLIAGERNLEFSSIAGDTGQTFLNRLRHRFHEGDAPFLASLGPKGELTIAHEEYGSDISFHAASNMAGAISAQAHAPEHADNGRDVEGRINRDLTTGKGRLLTGFEGTEAEGVKVRYTGNYDGAREDGSVVAREVGKVVIRQNAMNFQIGANPGQTFLASMMDVKPESLSRDVENSSGYRSLAEIDLRSFEGAQDAILLVDQAINQISSFRGRIGAVQKNSLESNIKSLKVANESIVSSESVIRDLDMAKGLADLTKSQIMNETSSSMFAQANQASKGVLQLVKDV